MDHSMNRDVEGSTAVMSRGPRILFNDLRHFTDLICDHTGVRFGPKRFGAVQVCLLRRLEELDYSSPADYFDFALKPENQGEWKKIVEFMMAYGHGA